MKEFNVNFNDGAFIHILDNEPNEYNVEFINQKTNKVEFSTVLKSNYWAKTSSKYYVNWLIRVKQYNKIVYEKKLDLTESDVYIKFESSSLGDNISWMPGVEVFRRTHNISKIYCSTHHNNFFIKLYPNIIFIEPDSKPIDSFKYVYRIGMFDDGRNLDMNPRNPYSIPLQEIIFDILDLPYEKNIHSPIDYKKTPNKTKDRYVCIAEHSTAQAKYWNYPEGWDIIVKHLNDVGYKVYSLSMEKSKIKGVLKPKNDSLKEAISLLEHCDFYIGISSGISWIAWALKKRVIMISGFSEPFCEFNTGCIRLHNEKVCNGCFNKPHTFVSFDKEDWLWCPMYKGTEDHFICSKSITPEEVITNINGLIDDTISLQEYNDLGIELIEEVEEVEASNMNTIPIEIINHPNKGDILIPTSKGELADKVAILTIKLSNIKDSNKLRNVQKEFNVLSHIMINDINIRIDDEDFVELLEVNKKLWKIEDAIRIKESKKEFDQEFIDLARSVYVTNDIRADIKKRINIRTGSYLIEEKSYEKY